MRSDIAAKAHTDPGAQSALASLDAAPLQDQERAAEVLADPVKSRAMLLEALDRAARQSAASPHLAAAVKNFGVTNTVDVGIGAVHWAWFKQDFRWQSNRNVYACNGYFTGVSGAASVDKDGDSKWSDSSYGHCSTEFTVSFVIKGVGGQLHKRMHSWGNATGWNTYELKNL